MDGTPYPADGGTPHPADRGVPLEVPLSRPGTKPGWEVPLILTWDGVPPARCEQMDRQTWVKTLPPPFLWNAGGKYANVVDLPPT